MEVKDTYIADVSRYSGPLRQAANDADKFKDKNDQAALAARKMGLAAKEAADKAARSQRDAADAAEKLARGEINAEEAAQAEARALKEVERAAIKAAEAERAVARAADNAADNMRQAARDAELAGAAQRLAALKAAGADKTHNLVLRELEAKYGDLSKEGSGAFKAIEKSSDSAFADVGSSGPGAIALVVAALAAVPFAATAAEGAITLGVGGALAGLGLYATKGDKQVQAALHGMTAHIKAETKQIAAPFKDTWLEIAQTGRETFDKLAPELKQDFAVLAPAVSRFASDAGVAITRLAPAFHAASNAAATLMDALGPKLPDITRNLGNSIEIMANSAAKSAPAFANMAVAASQLAPVLAHTLDLAVRLGPVFSPLFDAVSHGATTFDALRDGASKLSGGLISTDHSLQIASGSFPTFAQQATVAAAGAHQLMTAQQAAALSSSQLKNALTSLTSATQGAFDAETQYRQALLSTNAQAKQSNAGINGMGKAAIANRSALSQLAGAIKNVESSGHHTAAQIEAMRSKFISAAQGMGVSRSAAIALANKLLGVKSAANSIPGSRSIHLNDNTSTVRGHIAALQRSINQLHGKTVTVDYIERVHRTLQAERARADGGIDFYADGGMRRDLQPMIANRPTVLFGETETGGEAYIPLGQNKRARSTDLLGQVADMFGLELVKPLADGIVEKYAKGKVKHPTKAQRAAAAHRVDLARHRPEYLAALAAQQALASMRSSIYGGMFRGGPATIGSSGSTVVQHTTNVIVNVAGSIRSDREVAQVVQQQLLANRMLVQLPAGR